MFVDHQGTLVMVGGAEERKGERTILRKVASLCGDHGNMLVVSIAAKYQQDVGTRYQKVFSSHGVKDAAVVTMTDRSEADSSRMEDLLKSAAGVFFSGGDQLRITGMLGGTKFAHLLKERYREGTTLVAGTSAGASAMGQIMIVGGRANRPATHETTHISSGLGLLEGVVVDQHFAQRGRIGRLVSTIAENPEVLGLGIDEDTGVLLRSGREMEVLGSGSVTILDGHDISHSNLSEASLGSPLALSPVIMHVLPAGYRFDIRNRVLLE